MRYYKFKRKVSSKGEVKERVMAKLMLETPVTLDEIATAIQQQTAASEGDVLLVLNAIEQNVERYLVQGRAVKLGILGSFYPTINAKSVDDAKDVTPATITRVSCLFRPSKRLRTALGNAKLELADKDIIPAKPNRYADKEPEKKRKKIYKR